ncbi:MAG: hypothetical protein FWC78_05770 [Defluviitaleaceae bacterium]|nr:hypothetical protein [Defluviitaleaceae bacterium]
MIDLISQLLPFFVIVPIIIAVFLYVFSSKQMARKVAILFQAAFVVFAFLLLRQSLEGELLLNVGQYAGFLGIILRADYLAAIFVLLTSVIFLMLAIYSLNNDNTSLYWFLIFILEGAIVGLFLTRDFFNFFVLVEVSTVVVTILLMYDVKRRNMFTGIKFVMINIVAMQFYLFGVGYLYMITGALDMVAIYYATQEMDRAQLVLPYVLVMTSIAAKTSMLPTLTFLPKVNSMLGAHTPVAAIISGLQIKIGVYMFIRVQTVFGGVFPEARQLFLVVAIVSAFAGVVLALAQKEIRLVLAYSTMAQVSLIMIGLNIGGLYSFTGAVFHILNHAIFKVALFMAAGMIAHRYGTGDITKVRGLFRHSPVIAISTALAVLGMVGMPLFNGFVSKYFLAYDAPLYLEWIINVINLGTMLVFVRFSAMFFGRPNAVISESDSARQISTFVMGAACLVIGVGGVWIMRFLFGLDVEFTAAEVAEKCAIFLGSLVIALLVYRLVLAKHEIFIRLRGFDLSFKMLCASIGVFFGGFLLFL